LQVACDPGNIHLVHIAKKARGAPTSGYDGRLFGGDYGIKACRLYLSKIILPFLFKNILYFSSLSSDDHIVQVSQWQTHSPTEQLADGGFA
jgi:hypothetical protein